LYIFVILANDIHVHNALSLHNSNAKFQLNLLTQTIVTAAFVMSLQNVKCPVLTTVCMNPV